jgi:hypothetical protein
LRLLSRANDQLFDAAGGIAEHLRRGRVGIGLAIERVGGGLVRAARFKARDGGPGGARAKRGGLKKIIEGGQLVCLKGGQLFVSAEPVALQGKVSVPLAQDLLALEKLAQIEGRHTLRPGADGRTEGEPQA